MRMMGLEMRGWGLLGVGLRLSTGTVAQAQQQRSVCAENATAVPSTTGGDADRRAPSERNPHYTICWDDARLISFPLSPEVNQSHCSIRWIRRTAERLQPLCAGPYPSGPGRCGPKMHTRMYGRLNGERMRERIAELRSAFDDVLINSPRLNAYGQPSGRLSDGMVVPWRQTPRGGGLFGSAGGREPGGSGIPVSGAVLKRRMFPIRSAVYKRL